MSLYPGDEGSAGSQIMMLKKQLQDSKDERDTLRAAIQRLNVELSKYQAKYREPTSDSQVSKLMLTLYVLNF